MASYLENDSDLQKKMFSIFCAGGDSANRDGKGVSLDNFKDYETNSTTKQKTAGRFLSGDMGGFLVQITCNAVNDYFNNKEKGDFFQEKEKKGKKKKETIIGSEKKENELFFALEVGMFPAANNTDLDYSLENLGNSRENSDKIEKEGASIHNYNNFNLGIVIVANFSNNLFKTIANLFGDGDQIIYIGSKFLIVSKEDDSIGIQPSAERSQESFFSPHGSEINHEKNEVFVMQVILEYVDEGEIVKSIVENALRKCMLVETDTGNILQRVDEAFAALGENKLDKSKKNEKIRGTVDQVHNKGFNCQPSFSIESYQECGELLSWLSNNNFSFLGYCDYTLGSDGKFLLKEALGCAREMYICDNKEEENKDIKQLKKIYNLLHSDSENNFEIRRSEKISDVLRNETMDVLYFKIPEISANHQQSNSQSSGRVIAIIGFFKSRAYTCSIWEIPLIRRKMQRVFELNSGIDSRYLIEEIDKVLQSHPRGELLGISVEDLHNIVADVVSVSLVPQPKSMIYENKNNDSLNILVFVPKKNFSTNLRIKIENLLYAELPVRYCKKYVQITGEPLVRLLFNIGLTDEKSPPTRTDLERIRDMIGGAITQWEDTLVEALHKKYRNFGKAIKLAKSYNEAFSTDYMLNFSGEEGVNDMEMAMTAVKTKIIQYKFKFKSQSKIELRVYSPVRQLELSSILPITENLGFRTMNVSSYAINLEEEFNDDRGNNASNHQENNNRGEKKVVYMHYLLLRMRKMEDMLPDSKLSADICSNLEVTMAAIHYGLLDNDQFHSLITYAKINWREANVLRSMASYIKQSNIKAWVNISAQTLLQNSSIAHDLISYFNFKFTQIHRQKDDDLRRFSATISDKIAKVDDEKSQQILSAYLDLINAICRTNYLKTDKSGYYPSYLSFKIASRNLDWLSLPRPLFEIFVFSKDFEGIHLRFGKVARGGIRWSDRHNDFRYEILGLVKAQVIKNSIIVPTGAKGGFIVKSASSDPSKRNALQDGIACYKQFIRGMLDITDNNMNGKIIKPIGVVCYDEDDDQGDTYLVVAADKGTGAFSDYANQISKEEYNFFLGDAFASGGSKGYSHKALGITAKGCWVLLRQHLLNLGISMEKKPITMVGIGDMSGDVFGNGLIESNAIKLLAAFNHKHIFIDPNPDPQQSYEERVRLFSLPTSQWSDYNLRLISKGGGVFERSAKEIEISTEMEEALDIPRDTLSGKRTMSPDSLIRCIMRAPVDVIWNGGIGTYVKSSAETHEEVNDKANNALRVNGSELRCKIFSEGGNLGCTQLGRIEYARHGGSDGTGGLINTDSIDNSAGVDCSDHEVNIKILLEILQKNGEIDEEKRLQILKEVEGSVVDDVLLNNYLQGQIIDIESSERVNNLAEHAWFIRHLEKEGTLNREVEKLPSSDEFSHMQNSRVGLTRPEIAVVMSYAKNSIKKILGNGTKMSQNSFYKREMLTQYFPDGIHRNPVYARYIKNHPLANEIIIMQLANDFVNTMGCTLFHSLMQDEGFDPATIIASFVISKYATKMHICWNAIENTIGKVPQIERIEGFKRIQKVIKKNMIWILDNRHIILADANHNFDEIVPIIGLYVDLLIEGAAPNILPNSLQIINNLYRMVEPSQVKILSSLRHIGNIFSINNISNKIHCDINEVIKKYFAIRRELKIDIAIDVIESLAEKVVSDIGTKAVIENILSEAEKIAEKLCLKELSQYNESQKGVNSYSRVSDIEYQIDNKSYNKKRGIANFVEKNIELVGKKCLDSYQNSSTADSANLLGKGGGISSIKHSIGNVNNLKNNQEANRSMLLSLLVLFKKQINTLIED